MNTIVTNAPHAVMEASPWVRRWSHLVRPGGSVLDVACGHGRHMHWFAARGHAVTGIDRSGDAVRAVAALGEAVQADIETGPWPLQDNGVPRQFDAVVVTNYLWRPLLPVIQLSLAPGGVLIYETFSAGNETVGKPSRADFLLRDGELLNAFLGLRVVAYENGFLETPARFVQRLAAVNAAYGAAPPDASPVAPPVPSRFRL